MKEIFKKFLPPGCIFDTGSEFIDEFIVGITKNFSVVEHYIFEHTSEIPGHLSTQLPRWETILGIKAKGTHAERNNSVLGKLNSLGGCSLAYLSEVGTKLAGETISITDDKKPLLIEITGVHIELVNTFSCSSTCKHALREFVRSENVISGIEAIKHAYLGSRYYDKEKTVYAQD